MNPTDIPIRDLMMPAAVGWWPLAPGWWTLLALLVVVLTVLAYRARRRWRVGRARRFALAELKRLENEYVNGANLVEVGTSLSELVRRTMLAYAPRAEVAGLTGERWLAWLDEGLANPTFETGPGRALAELPYLDPDASHDDIDFNGLVYAVRMRLATPVTSGEER